MKESLALGNEKSLSISLINQAALSLAEEAYRLTKDHGYTALTKQIKTILDNIRDSS
jgi:hypothetical protein